MRNLLVLLFLCCSLTISGATYYVSPSGSDSNPGTIGQPFFTLNKAWSVVSAGDIVYGYQQFIYNTGKYFDYR